MPIRLIQFLSVVAVFSLAYPYIRWLSVFVWTRWLMAPLIGLFAMLGRNSLYVFCIGSLLSLAGQVIRYIFRGTVGVDTAVVISGILIMAVTAWLAELRERGRKERPARA